MEIDEIRALMAMMAASDLSEMEVEKDGWTLRLKRAAPPVDAPAPAASLVVRPPAVPKVARAAENADIRSPLSGVVHFSSAPGAPPFVEPGTSVEAGDILCLVEAMKMFNEIRAERAGRVEALLVCAGDDVDAGQPLLKVV